MLRFKIYSGFLNLMSTTAVDKSHIISFSWRLPASCPPRTAGMGVGESSVREGTLKMQGVLQKEKCIDMWKNLPSL